MDEQKMGTDMKSGHGMMHWACCLMPIVSTLAYIWGVLSLIFAFVAGEGAFWGMGAAGWMWSGLVAGILALGKGKRGHGCGHGAGCQCAGGKCC